MSDFTCRKCGSTKNSSEFYQYDSRNCKQCRREASRRSFGNGDVRVEMWKRAKFRAERDGLEFTIEVEDIVVPDKCPIYDRKLVLRDKWWTPSLDRIDNSQGYVPGNVAVISNKANSIKSDASLDVLKRLAEYVRCCEPIDKSAARKVIREKRKRFFYPTKKIFVVKNENGHFLKETGRFGTWSLEDVVQWPTEISARMWVKMISTRSDLVIEEREVPAADLRCLKVR